MWDCKHRHAADDSCNRRKTKCFPGGIGCVLKEKYEFPCRDNGQDPLLKAKTAKKHPASKTPKGARQK